MRILISDGGVAGLTLANFLHRYGFVPVLVEQAAGMCRDRYAINFFGTGYDVAERMNRPAALAIWRRQPLAEAGVAPLQR